jgi:hypothetical protein
MREQLVTLEEMRTNLRSTIGLNVLLHIEKKNQEYIVGFIRGFADSQCNILLVSEETDSMSMRIVEIKNINAVEYPVYTTSGTHAVILRSKP